MRNANKKIKNATPITKYNIQFKSRLELNMYEVLLRKGYNPEYEPNTYVLWEGIETKVPSYKFSDKTKLLKQDKKKLLNITYTPDFVFKTKDNKVTVFLEIKGFENDVFPIKKKLFRAYLETLNIPMVYFEIKNKKQLLQALDILEDYGKEITD